MDLAELLKEEFRTETTVQDNNFVGVAAGTVTQLLNSNPRRLAALIVNMGANEIYVAPFTDVSNTNGIFLAPTGGVMSLYWNTDFESVSHDWYGVPDGGASNIYVLETIAVG